VLLADNIVQQRILCQSVNFYFAQSLYPYKITNILATQKRIIPATTFNSLAVQRNIPVYKLKVCYYLLLPHLCNVSVHSQTNQRPVYLLMQQRRLKLFRHKLHARAASSTSNCRLPTLRIYATQEVDHASLGLARLSVVSKRSTLVSTQQGRLSPQRQ